MSLGFCFLLRLSLISLFFWGIFSIRNEQYYNRNQQNWTPNHTVLNIIPTQNNHWYEGQNIENSYFLHPDNDLFTHFYFRLDFFQKWLNVILICS